MGHGEHGARAYNGGLVAEPPAGSRGRAPDKGSGEAESFEAFPHLKKAQMAIQGGYLSIFQPSGEQVLPSRGCSAPLPTSMGAHNTDT